MDFLNKLENFVNAFLIKLGEKMLSILPARLRDFFGHLDVHFFKLVAFIKALPVFIKGKLPGLKSAAANFNFKEKIVQPLIAAAAKYNSGKKDKAGKFKILFVAPYLVMKEWFHGLTPAQSLLLLFFTGASVISSFSIISSSSLLMKKDDAGRTPASADEVSYDRPDYYKKDQKHFTVSNFRLPVYLPNVNELRSVDIDFTATMTTRESRMYLEKTELQLRDYLIHEIEPSIAQFPLSDEGKEIIRKKIESELNNFLIAHKVQGQVESVKVTYILAN